VTPIYDQLCAARGIRSHRAPRRFRIYRAANRVLWHDRTYVVWSWVLQDQENPANVLRFAGWRGAVAGMDRVLREERAGL
jgi:hypothetical protein